MGQTPNRWRNSGWQVHRQGLRRGGAPLVAQTEGDPRGDRTRPPSAGAGGSGAGAGPRRRLPRGEPRGDGLHRHGAGLRHRCGALPAVVGAALDEIDRVDRLMSHYRRDSPLSRLNREAAIGPVAVEPELLDFLAAVPALEPRVGRGLRRHRRPAHEGVGLLPRGGPRARRGGAGPGARRRRLPARRAGQGRRDGPLRSPRRRARPRWHRQGLRGGSRRVAPAPAGHRLGPGQPRRQQRLRARCAAGETGVGDRDPGPDRPGEDGPHRAAA